MRTAAFLFIVLYGATLAGAELHAEAAVIKVVFPRDDLRTWCRIEGNYDACTTFVAFRLEATCVEEPGVWRMMSSATYRPLIFLKNLTRLAHEQEHLEDIFESVDSHLAGLERLRFDTIGGCQDKVLLESAAFGKTMREFARRSNLARHPRLAAR